MTLHPPGPNDWCYCYYCSVTHIYSGVRLLGNVVIYVYLFEELLSCFLKQLNCFTFPPAVTSLHSAFFVVQLSHPCITTGKTTALTIQTFVGKVMALCSGHVTEVRTTSPFVAWVYVTDRNIGGLLNRRMRVGNYQKPYIKSLWREPATSCDF